MISSTRKKLYIHVENKQVLFGLAHALILRHQYEKIKLDL